jgi:quercetin dioxygenase-like cupin family protein
MERVTTDMTTNMTQDDLLVIDALPIPAGAHAMIRLLELPPGDPGLGPHRHSGPVFGYMIEGEMLFELEGEAPYRISAGEGFFEAGGDVIHYTAANLLSDRTSRFVVVMLCAPDVEMITLVDDDELAAKASSRIPVPTDL